MRSQAIVKPSLIALLLLLISQGASSQAFSTNEKGQFVTSINLMTSVLNDEVIINDIRYPDENFDCLQALGTAEISERHTLAGDEHNFTYDGLVLRYHNTNDEERMTLAHIEMTGNATSLKTANGVSLSTSENFKSYLESSESERLDLVGEKKLLVLFSRSEGAKIIFNTKDEEIQRIRMWF